MVSAAREGGVTAFVFRPRRNPREVSYRFRHLGRRSVPDAEVGCRKAAEAPVTKSIGRFESVVAFDGEASTTG